MPANKLQKSKSYEDKPLIISESQVIQGCKEKRWTNSTTVKYINNYIKKRNKDPK